MAAALPEQFLPPTVQFTACAVQLAGMVQLIALWLMVPVAALQVAVTEPVVGAVLSVTTWLLPPVSAPRAPVQLLAPCVQFSAPAAQLVVQVAPL